MDQRANCEDENGGSKLPIGFRFYPTDEELVVHYLKRKVFSLPLPPTLIPDWDIFHSNPWHLPGNMKEKRYFFCQRKGNSIIIMTKCNSKFGYWKAIGKDKQIVAPGTNLLIGIKKSFVFYKSKKSRRVKTQWIMHQFCLVGSVNTPCLTQKLMIQVGDWVVCKVYQRKRKARNYGTNTQCRTLHGIKASEHNINRASISSCSSGITDVSCNDLDQEANSL